MQRKSKGEITVFAHITAVFAHICCLCSHAMVAPVWLLHLLSWLWRKTPMDEFFHVFRAGRLLTPSCLCWMKCKLNLNHCYRQVACNNFITVQKTGLLKSPQPWNSQDKFKRGCSQWNALWSQLILKTASLKRQQSHKTKSQDSLKT